MTLENAEWISYEMFELGASGIQELDNELLAFFTQGESIQALTMRISRALYRLRERLQLDWDVDFEIREQPVRDWRSEWKKNLAPVAVGRSLLIKPSWCEFPLHPPKYIVEIDPEMAFGSGTHSTTLLMLEALEDLVQPGFDVLDVGCGTGILSIAALKLGAASAVAFDIDPVAAQTTRRNAEKNNVDAHLNVFTGTLNTLVPRFFDLVLANVNRSQLEAMLPTISKLMKSATVCLLSGILDTERSLFSHVCRDNGFFIDRINLRDE